MDEEFCNRVGRHRIAARQIDELLGLTRGLCADGKISQSEAEFLQKWLAAGAAAIQHPIIRNLYSRVDAILADGVADEGERDDLFSTLNAFSPSEMELGETLKASNLPIDDPEPPLTFSGQRYCLTGTFTYGRRKDCEGVLLSHGAEVGSLTKKTDVLVIGAYATESWRHSAFGNKILAACSTGNRASQ